MIMTKAMTLVFVFLILLITADADDDVESSLDGFLVYPIVPSKTNIRKRETAAANRNNLQEKKKSNDDQYQTFFLDKLLQHTKALEHLMEKVDANEDSIKSLINNFGNKKLEPKMPEKVHVPTAPPGNVAEPEHPVVKLGKNISKYGVLVKDMILNDMRDDSEPEALVEHNLASNSSFAPLSLSRRSFGGGTGPEFSPPPAGVSPWCLVATLCRRSAVPICGFDDRFGYGKFDDLCHMLQVNCFYNYNFGVVAHCRPFYV